MLKRIKSLLGRNNVRVVHCPDGTTATVYDNIDDGLPLFIEEQQRRVAADARVVGQFGGSAEVAESNEVAQTLFDVDSVNRTLQIAFRMYYRTYASDPCGLRQWLADRVDERLRQEQATRFIALMVDRIGSLDDTNATEILLAVTELKRLADGTAPATRLSIDRAADDIHDWEREETDG